MSRKDNGFAPVLEFEKHIFEENLVDGIKTGEWFIENDERGIVNDRDDKLDFLLVAFGEFFDLSVFV
jgi:hypothetical protein